MKPKLPDYRYKQLAEALASFGKSDYSAHHSLRQYISATPDKEFYFFTKDTEPDKVLVLLTEDYISGLDYVKDCLSKEINAELLKLHKVIRGKSNSDFDSRQPVAAAATYQPPDDWNELSLYAVDFLQIFFGFLATVKPLNPEQFWIELPDRLERF